MFASANQLSTRPYYVYQEGGLESNSSWDSSWDTSTLDCEKIFEVDITGVGNEDQVRTLTFKPDGTRMFVGGKTQDKIRIPLA